jgi:hypothetical protein
MIGLGAVAVPDRAAAGATGSGELSTSADGASGDHRRRRLSSAFGCWLIWTQIAFDEAADALRRSSPISDEKYTLSRCSWTAESKSQFRGSTTPERNWIATSKSIIARMRTGSHSWPVGEKPNSSPVVGCQPELGPAAGLSRAPASLRLTDSRLDWLLPQSHGCVDPQRSTPCNQKPSSSAFARPSRLARDSTIGS